ncbi:lysophospholipase D GDPD1-like [Lissotriton helveticus]
MHKLLYYVLPALGGYAATSCYLLKHPLLLHRKKELAFHCRHISHRGGAGEKIENTMEAFTNAVKHQTDLLELDCHLTKDGRVVVSHDLNLLRQTGHDVCINDLNYLELPLYKDNLEVTFLSGHHSTGCDKRIPELEEVFQKYPNIPINIEIKEDDDELIKKVSDLVRRYHRCDRTIWASVNNRIMKKCRAENPQMPFMFTKQRGALLLLLFYTGLLPFVPLPESVMETVMPSIINRTFLPENKLLKNKYLVRLQEKLMMRRTLVQHLQDRGIQVYFWVLNQESDFQKAWSLGATGIMTDYPSKLRGFLNTTDQASRLGEGTRNQ